MFAMNKRQIAIAILQLTFLLNSQCVALSIRQSDGTLEVKYRLEEEQEVGKYVGNVRDDTHLDSLYSADVMHQLHFRFLRQHQQQLPFVIDENTGIITTSGRVNRDVICPGEETCDVKLDVAVQPAQYFRLIRVTIAILDINDNPPRFPDAAVHFEILESAVVGTGLVLPVAVDPDSPQFSVRGYRDVTHSDTFNLREIRKPDSTSGSGELRLVLARPLDRERVDRYRLKIMAVDGGTPARSGVVDVFIEVLDVNDNSPVFERHEYQATIVENAPPRTVVARVVATDADAGLNGQIVYSFSSLTANSFGHIFAVTNTSGDVYVVGPVDYEERSAYKLVVVARDLGPESVAASATLTVKVTDTNDNAPEISIDTLTGNTGVAVASEDAEPGTFVAHVAVSDRDSGSAGQVDCVVSDGHFRLKPMSSSDDGDEYQLVTAAMLDRESRGFYDVGIVCRDRGPEPRERVERIKIEITDVNDNDPHFRYPSYRTELIENNYVGAVVLRVNASDADDGDNAALRYSLQGGDGFEVDEDSGVIKATESFDRELAGSYRFFVVASDRGKPASRSSSSEVIVDIVDVNDEEPRFEHHAYSLDVDENSPVGTEVGTVKAVDPDVGSSGHVTYTTTSKVFSVDRETGRITTLQRLDREVFPVYKLKVVATDSGRLCAGSTTLCLVKLVKLFRLEDPASFVAVVRKCAILKEPQTIIPSASTCHIMFRYLVKLKMVKI